MPLQWFPGHMTKAVRQIKENLSRADIVIEVLDARIPLSSRNPMIDDIVGKMPRLIVLNKADLADPNLLPQWEKALKGEKENIQVVQISAKTGKNLPQLIEKAKILCQKASWAGRRGGGPWCWVSPMWGNQLSSTTCRDAEAGMWRTAPA